jgi:hypothetical protein
VLEGRIITADSLLTQREIARSIIERGGHYLLAVKDNQPALREDIALVFADSQWIQETITEARTVDQHGGRIEERRLRTSTALCGYTDWPRSQARTGRIPQVMAALRNVAISRLRLWGAENIAAATRRYAARPSLALAAVVLNLRE